MGYLQNINRLSGVDNLGGIITFQVFRASEIQSIGDPIDGTIYGDIVMQAGKTCYIWECTMESGRFASSTILSREGTAKQNRKNFIIPKDRPGIKAMLDQAELDEFVVLYTDSNGQKILFGTPSAPIRFQFNYDTGTTFAALNSYNCSFYFDGPDNRYFYNGTIPAPVPGAAPSVVKFNGLPIASLAAGDTLNIISEFGFTDFFITT